MHTYASAYSDLSAALQAIYDAREGASIAHEVLEHITGDTRLQRITDKDKQLTTEQHGELDRMKDLLLKGTPLQYVLGTAWFMGREYIVNEHVLIPRPETEELVQWIVEDWKSKQPSVLDIGSGSGCIPVSVNLSLPGAVVSSVDVSDGAIGVAMMNAVRLDANVSFRQLDFLDKSKWHELPSYDVIVSNPPYIPETEHESLHTNVRDFEPHLALFVPGNDALLFYRNIAEFGLTHLNEGGTVYCELHVDYAMQTMELFKTIGYVYAMVKQDIHGNFRMLKAQK